MQSTITENGQKLFYFFLRKTGSADAAHDLAGDVLLIALTALRRGADIGNPEAWLWRVARNRYAAWADEKRRSRERLTETADIPNGAELEERVIHQDDLNRMRRELAFISREHRELIVAHYLQGEPLTDIAQRLQTPLGTVKARLHRVRRTIMEGMQMNRTFGKRSYTPETMDFVTSGNQPSELPECAMRRKLSLNILLEASENPCTIENLAMALGVAAPYMEEEVRLLEKATLLRKSGGRYITDFYIMDGETQRLLRRTLREHACVHTSAVTAIAADALPLLQGMCAHIPANELMWWLLPHVHEDALFSHPDYVSDLPERACGKGETWGIVGFEKAEMDWQPCFLGRCTASVPGGLHGIYNYDHPCEAMWERAGMMDGRCASLLIALAAGNRPLSAMTAAERSAWDTLDGVYAHEEGGFAVPDVVLLSEKQLTALNAAIRAHPAYAALADVVDADFRRIRAILKQRSSPILHDQLNYVTSHEVLNARMMVLSDCLDDGLLTLPENPEKSTVGIWLEVR